MAESVRGRVYSQQKPVGKALEGIHHMTISQVIIVFVALLMPLQGCSSSGSSSGSSGGSSGGSVPATTAPFGVVGNTYFTILPPGSGTPPFTWSVSGGSLPPGLVLNSATGEVTGTPTAAGNFTPTIAVKNSSGQVTTSSVL